MIKFGKTNEEALVIEQKKYNKEQMKLERLMNGVKKFAWLPVKIMSGEYVWLTTYYQYYSAYVFYKNNIRLILDNNDKPIVRNYLDKSSEYINAAE